MVEFIHELRWPGRGEVLISAKDTVALKKVHVTYGSVKQEAVTGRYRRRSYMEDCVGKN